MINRREWLKGAAFGVAGLGCWPALAEGLRYSRPRATSMDSVEPDWEERMVVTAGGEGADIGGFSEKSIQAAIDLVSGRGGGTVKLTAGTFELRNSVWLRPGVRLCGMGQETVLLKAPMVETRLAEDSDWYDQEVTLVDASGWQVGDGICLVTKNPHDGGQDVLKRTLVARSGARFKLDKALRENFWTGMEPTASSLFPLLTADEETRGLVVEGLVLDGNRSNNGNLDGNYAGGIWLQNCADVTVRRVTARNYNGDGISWQICHDVVVENCQSHDNAGLGLHPGSGSQRPVIRNCRLERNGIGLFFCWGVKAGLAEKNHIADNLEVGVSIGHRDDENVVRDNDILRSGQCGLLFRPERGEGFTAKGNLIENNRIIDSGGEADAAVDIQGVTAGNNIAKNTIRETRGPAKRIGIRIGAEAGENALAENVIEGYSISVQDLRSA